MRAGALPRVMAVDDDAMMRAVLHTVFTAAGLPVQVFASAAEWLAHAPLPLQGQPPQGLLLLDVKMPGMSGPELHTLLRERGSALPVVFLTGSADVGIAVTAMRNGAVDFIEKPFIADDLVRRVRSALAAGRPLPGAAGAPRSSQVEALHQRRAGLTPREQVVLRLMVTGMASKQMARELGGSFRTIDIHRARVMQKMAAANLAELVRMSITMDTA